jgi:tRNA acetyltransferase TAN1
MRNFNLLISTPRRLEYKACAEIWFLLAKIGDQNNIVKKTHISGLVVAKTILDPIKVIEDIRTIIKEHPQDFQFVLKIVPIEMLMQTNLSEIKKASAKLFEKILKNETYRVTVVKRHSEISKKDIIKAITENATQKVNLENPEKIFLVEVLGGITGLSVIKPKQILSLVKEATNVLQLR